MQGVSVQQFADKMRLTCFTPCVDMTKRFITKSDVNRPALELTGFFEHFAKERVQVIGMVEHSYLENLPQELRYQRYAQLLDHDVPCVVMC